VRVLTVGGVLLFLAAVTALQLWWFQREATRKAAETRERIESALAQVKQALREDQIDRAIAALKNAPFDQDQTDLQRELERCAWALARLRRLGNYLRMCWRIDHPGGYHIAFKRAQPDDDLVRYLSPELLKEAFASPAAEQLARALDEQYALNWVSSPRAGMLNEFDNDPQRCEARTAWAIESPARVQALAAKVDLETMSPRLAILLGANQLLPTGERVRLLQRAHARFPEDVPIAVLLGWALGERDGGLQPADATMLVPCFRAATKRYPESDATWANLGYLVLRGKDLAGAREVFHQDILSGSSVRRYWLTDRAFADIRDPESLAKLPENERKEWQKFWDEVRDLQPGAEK
jgi:hypothetical protein